MCEYANYVQVGNKTFYQWVWVFIEICCRAVALKLSLSEVMGWNSYEEMDFPVLCCYVFTIGRPFTVIKLEWFVSGLVNTNKTLIHWEVRRIE
jgi:hypothetical protein